MYGADDDLGIISAVDSKEDKRNIAAVTDMVKEHIQGNTLILLTITMRGRSWDLGFVLLGISLRMNLPRRYK
jgi:hypothetical protein